MRISAIGIVVFTLTTTLSACDMVKSFTRSPDEKINAAFPISAEVRVGMETLLTTVSESQREDMESQFASRLKLRALNCAKTYTPSHFSSTSDVRSALNNPSCFASADAEMAKWLGYHRVALALALPPLRSIPASAPNFIVASEFIQFPRFASRAGIVMVETSQTIEALDFESAKPVFKEAKLGTRAGWPSPNGRLFTQGRQEDLQIRETETGAIFLEIRSAEVFSFSWVDDRTAVYKSRDGKVVFVDWESGREAKLTLGSHGHVRAIAVPGTKSEYILFTNEAASRVELVRNKSELDVRLLSDRSTSRVLWAHDNATVTSDGKRYISAFGDLNIANLETFQFDTVALEPFHLYSASAMSDPDKVLVYGKPVPTRADGAAGYFIYSLAEGTIATVDTARLSVRRLLYAESLRKLVDVSESKMTVIDDLPLTAPVAIADFTGQVRQALNQRKLEAFEREQIERTTRQSQANGPFQHLARDAQIWAIGVYEGGGLNERSRMARDRGAGNVIVRVRHSSQPIVLVVSSQESVVWNLLLEPGARLAAVIVASNKDSVVVGAGNAKVLVLKKAYAYERDERFEALNREVVKITGKPITTFQGRRSATMFSVGGS